MSSYLEKYEVFSSYKNMREEEEVLEKRVFC